MLLAVGLAGPDPSRIIWQIPDILACMQDRPEHWTRVKEVLDLALQAAPSERSRVVREACTARADLERDVAPLLQYSEQSGTLDDCLQETVRGLPRSAPRTQRI